MPMHRGNHPTAWDWHDGSMVSGAESCFTVSRAVVRTIGHLAEAGGWVDGTASALPTPGGVHVVLAPNSEIGCVCVCVDSPGFLNPFS